MSFTLFLCNIQTNALFNRKIYFRVKYSIPRKWLHILEAQTKNRSRLYFKKINL